MMIVLSWTRDNNINNFLYNLYNESSEMNATTGLYDLPYRNYDAALGRFFQVDPLAHRDHSVSPFAYAGNNPVMLNDPSGLMVNYSDMEERKRRAQEKVFEAEMAAANAHLWSDDAVFGGAGGWWNSSTGGASSYYTTFQDATDVISGKMSMETYVAKYGTEVDMGSEMTATVSNVYFYTTSTAGADYTGSQLHADVDLQLNYRTIQRVQTQGDASTKFYFISNEADAYKSMLALQEVSHGEIAAFLVTKKGTDEKGVLILPWSGNKEKRSWPYHGISFTNKTLTDHNGVEYIPSLFLHTHPGEQFSPSGLGGDQSTLSNLNKLWPGLTGGILTESFYTPYDTSLQPRQYTPTLNGGLLDGSNSLFK